MNLTDKVMIGWVDGGNVTSKFMHSVTKFLLKTPFNVHDVKQVSSVFVTANRNDLVRELLASDCDWLVTLDTDVVFEPETLERLLENADKIERPFVNGWYHLVATQPHQVFYPDVFNWREDLETWASVSSLPRNQLIPVDFVGFGAAVLHRSMLEALADENNPKYGWFVDGVQPFSNGESIQEDFYFCKRAREHGFRVWVDTEAYFQHQKSIVIDMAQNNWVD